MDQPGNSHYPLNMSQQTLNGHGGYYGRDYEANGHEGNGCEANGYAFTEPDEGEGPVGQACAGQDAGGPATNVAPDGLDGQDATGSADGEPMASGDSASAADRMRKLLARSTVDHAASERATAAALDGLRERLAGLEHAVAEIAERAEAERSAADRVAEQLAPQAQRLAGVSATLDGLTASLSTFRAQISGIDGKLVEADSRLAGADVKLASTEGRVTALDTRFERLDERLDDQYDRVSSIDERLSSIDGRLTSIDGQVAAADGRIIALGEQFTDAIAPLADELRARPDGAELQEVVMKIVEAAHTDLSTRLRSLEDTVLTLAEALLRPAPGHAPAAP
jgi:predicted  nucleic acid-binding Zn-ribbon protein